MSDSGMAQFVELLSVARGRTDLDANEKRPVIIVTIRPEPDRSWAYHHLSLSIAQAERLRDDLISLLKIPATFLLLAVLTLTAGCSARVEVVNERPVAVEADTVPSAADSAKHRTAVEIDFLGQQQPEPVVPKVASEHPSTAEVESEPDVRGDVTVIVVKTIHKHRHYHLPDLVGRQRWVSRCDEAERIRRFHEMKMRQYGER